MAENNNLTDMELFKIIHSELIMSVQYIEQDLRIIYSMLKTGDFNNNYEEVDKKPLGALLKSLKDLDKDLGFQKIKDKDYMLLDNIREIRNYWCHQCYLDFHYIDDIQTKSDKFYEIKDRLHKDEEEIYKLQQKIERLRRAVVKKYKRRKANCLNKA